MMKSVVSITALLALAAVSHADVNGYAITYSASYNQIGDVAPPDNPTCYLTASISSLVAGDLLSATLSTPSLGDFDLYDASYGAGTYFVCYSGPFASTADFAAAHPAGTYTFNLLTGGAAPGSGTIEVHPADFSYEIPYLTNLSSLQMLPAGLDAEVTWNPFTRPGFEPDAETGFYIVDYTAAVYAWGAAETPESTGTTIPGAQLISGHTYAYNVAYRSWERLNEQGFGGALSDQVYERNTGALIHCAANPGTVAGKLTLSDYYYPLGQPVTVQVVAQDGTIEDEQTITLGYEGYYAFDTAVTGTKTITFKNPRFLRLAVENVDLSVGQDFINPVLINGDVDDDNAVTIFDYLALSDAFDSTAADAWWDARADLDGDGTITIFDYLILSNNFDLSGWEPS
ncbi:MAG: hypothetical protein JST40_10820 [Armatimonadetes bacterium]|nr:hypothetical protein [Armatimonadota bacterium]